MGPTHGKPVWPGCRGQSMAFKAHTTWPGLMQGGYKGAASWGLTLARLALPLSLVRHSFWRTPPLSPPRLLRFDLDPCHLRFPPLCWCGSSEPLPTTPLYRLPPLCVALMVSAGVPNLPVYDPGG
jgi:hypothetical protein